jgi:hypothetical protein
VAYNQHKIANVSSLLYWPTVFEKNVLSRTKQGSSAVPVGSVVDRKEGSKWNPKEFYLKPKRVLLWGQPRKPFF